MLIMDITRLTPLWQRWYFNVAVVFWALALCAMIAATAWALLGQPRTALLFSGLGAGLLVALLTWQTCVYPWCRAGDGPCGHVDSPQRELRDLQFVIWLPPIALALLSLLLWFGEPAVRHYLQSYFHWYQTNRLAPLLTLGIAPLSLWSYTFSRLVTRRFRQRTAFLRVCFNCGYDLHASPSPTCPECGRAAF